MNLRAREDAVSLAQSEVQRAEERVRKAQEAMRNFRDAHTLLDPRATAAGLQGVVTELEGEAVKLRAQLAEAQSFMRSSAPATKALWRTNLIRKSSDWRASARRRAISTLW